MISVCMPQVGENLTLGVVLEWLKDVGDPVARGDVIAIVESEKAAFEVTAERAGVLLRIDCPAGREAQVLKPIAWIGEPGEVVPAALEDPPETTAPLQNEPIAAWHPRSVDLRGMSTAATFTSPSARRLARQLLVDLATVRGSGPSGRIVRRDVLAAALSDCGGTPAIAATVEPVVEGGDRVQPHGRLRAAIAERMTISARSVPHFYLFADIDVTDAQALRATLGGDPPVSLTDFVVAAVARSLRRHERLNAHVGARGIILKAGCHVGLAVAVDDGVLVPSLIDADRRSLEQLAELRRQAITSARDGVVAPKPSPTFTVTSLAGYGVERFLPIINPPECAILAVGRSGERVVARDGNVVVREQLTLCLACDHRAVDGAGAAGFLQTLTGSLEAPAGLVQAEVGGS